MGASSTGKCRSPQTAPRLRRPYGWLIEPIWSPEGVLDAFRAQLPVRMDCLAGLRSVTLSLFRVGAGASGVVLAGRLFDLYDNYTIRASGGQVSYDLSPVAPPRSDISA